MRKRLPVWFALGALLLILGGGFGCPVAGTETLTDPTRPPAVAADQSMRKGRQSPQWRLTATLIGPARRVAVINDRAMQIGETIDGAVLVEVASGSAFLVHEGRRLHLQLNAKTVKHTARTAP